MSQHCMQRILLDHPLTCTRSGRLRCPHQPRSQSHLLINGVVSVLNQLRYLALYHARATSCTDRPVVVSNNTDCFTAVTDKHFRVELTTRIVRDLHGVITLHGDEVILFVTLVSSSNARVIECLNSFVTQVTKNNLVLVAVLV